MNFEIRQFTCSFMFFGSETSDMAFDCRTVERFQDIEKLTENEKEHIFALLDAFLAKSKMQEILK